MKPDPHSEEKEVFAAFITRRHLKRSGQRDVILDTFLRSDRHVSVEQLLQLVRKRRADIGRSTVYRTLKLLQEAGLAQELPLPGESQFEPDYKRQHHDHFVCSSCGGISEFTSPEIERIQDEVAARIGFVIQGHRHHIYGLCQRCAARPQQARR